MEKNEQSLWVLWKKYGEHLTAPLILIALIVLGYQLYQDNQLKKEIQINCGWAEEDYQCYCEKGTALEIKKKMENPNYQINSLNISPGEFDDSLDG